MNKPRIPSWVKLAIGRRALVSDYTDNDGDFHCPRCSQTMYRPIHGAVHNHQCGATYQAFGNFIRVARGSQTRRASQVDDGLGPLLARVLDWQRAIAVTKGATWS